MAAGDIVIFNVFYEALAEEHHNLETDVIKLGLITSTITPTRDDATAAWSAGSGVDYDGNEVTPGGNYSAGGPTLANNVTTLSQANDDLIFDVDDLTIAQNGSNPTNARWGIIYNETATTPQDNPAIGFLDLGAVTDLSAAALTITWGANGIFRMGLGTVS